jgi:hypothetical protein
MLAHMTGVDPVDVMLGLSEVGSPYRVAVGIEQERSTAFKAISENNAAGCIVDVATYHCIRRLELEDAVAAVCGKIGIAQATADIYQHRLRAMDTLVGDGCGGTIGHHDGKFYFHERSREELAKSRAIIESDVRWLTANADVVPALPLQDPPAIFRRLGTVKGGRFFDEVFAASGSKRLLVVDDLFTRQVAGLLGTPATWLQPILMVARNRKIITLEQYAKAIADLAGIGQSFISVDSAMLIAARELDRQNQSTGLGRRFKDATRLIGGKNADPSSHCRVVFDFLNQLWSKNEELNLDDYAATSHLLRELLKDRTNDYRRMLFSLDQSFGHLPALREYLRAWVRGHFLNL